MQLHLVVTQSLEKRVSPPRSGHSAHCKRWWRYRTGNPSWITHRTSFNITLVILPHIGCCIFTNSVQSFGLSHMIAQDALEGYGKRGFESWFQFGLSTDLALTRRPWKPHNLIHFSAPLVIVVNSLQVLARVILSDTPCFQLDTTVHAATAIRSRSGRNHLWVPLMTWQWHCWSRCWCSLQGAWESKRDGRVTWLKRVKHYYRPERCSPMEQCSASIKNLAT